MTLVESLMHCMCAVAIEPSQEKAPDTDLRELREACIGRTVKRLRAIQEWLGFDQHELSKWQQLAKVGRGGLVRILLLFLLLLLLFLFFLFFLFFFFLLFLFFFFLLFLFLFLLFLLFLFLFFPPPAFSLLVLVLLLLHLLFLIPSHSQHITTCALLHLQDFISWTLDSSRLQLGGDGDGVKGMPSDDKKVRGGGGEETLTRFTPHQVATLFPKVWHAFKTTHPTARYPHET